ncbi:MAG: CARDB domain-containing protein [Owenweeksia sp.]|nr:CARDB domain-containing protein [Owenweeksia sp.]
MYYNSFLNDSAAGNAAYFYNNNGLNLKNNNLVHLGTGRAIYANNLSQFSSSNYNNFYTNGTELGYAGTAITDLAAWQFSTGRDANSVSLDPLFVSAENLHIRLTGLDRAGTPLSGVSEDIDGDMQDANYPDIGADEVVLFPDDIAVNDLLNLASNCSLGDSLQVTVNIKNNGTFAQSSFDLVMVVNNDTTRETINTTLNGGTSVNYSFAPYLDFSAVQPYQVRIWSELAGDVNLANDTLEKIIYHFSNPNVSLNADTTICAGSKVNLLASGGTSYAWSNGSSGANIQVSPGSTSVYAVTVTDINSCSATDSVKITVVTPPAAATITADGSTTVCSGDSLLLYASLANDILWSTGESNDSIYVSQSGSYTLSYNQPGSVCGQVVLDTINIIVVKDSITLNSFQTICLGDAVILTATNFPAEPGLPVKPAKQLPLIPLLILPFTPLGMGPMAARLQILYPLM